MIVTNAHKDFILGQMQKLAIYDSKRPSGHVYEFHLHSERVAQSVKNLAMQMHYNSDMCEALYWATLPHDIGKMALPVAIWDTPHQPTDAERQRRRSHTLLGVEIIRDEFGADCTNDPFLKLLIDIMANHHEAMDGSGYGGKTAPDLSQEVRMACICDAFDGWSVKRAHFADDRDLSPAGVINRMETEKKGQFDTLLFSQFKDITL